MSQALLSRLGFGVAGPLASILISDTQCRALIGEALGAGITHFHTAPSEGRGRAELRLGRALRGVQRNQVFVSTRAGHQPDGLRDFSRGAVEISLKESLARLKLDYVDMLVLDGPTAPELTDRLIKHLEAFRSRGLFRQLAIRASGPELDMAVERGAFDAVFTPVHGCLDAEAIARLERCKSAGLTVIGTSPLAASATASGLPTSPRKLWYAIDGLKKRLSRHSIPTRRLSAEVALEAALSVSACNFLVFHTTQSTHLRANARQAGLNPPAAQPSS